MDGAETYMGSEVSLCTGLEDKDTVRNSSAARGIRSSDKEDKVQVARHMIASSVEEEVTRYTSASGEESSEEQREPAAVYNVCTAIQKRAFEAMDMLQLEIQSVKEENEKFKKFFSKIMECGGDEYHQIIERGGLNELQHRVQEIINRSGKAEREYDQSTTVNSNHTSELRDEVECHKDQCCEQGEELMQNKGKLKLCEEKSEHHQAKVKRQLFLQSKEQQQVAGPVAYGVANNFLERHSEDKHLSNDQSKKWEHLGASPKDRPAKTDRCPEPSSLNSSEDLVPQQVAGPVAHGVANKFLERHSEDKLLHQNLYYTNAEKMLTESDTESVESINNSLLKLDQRFEEAGEMVERVLLKEREEREVFGREIERKEPVTGQSLWLCGHYQRHCRVRFPCCNNFYSCHRCHNNSNECENEEAKASHATLLKCSYCHHEQEIGKDSGKCCSCGENMSAYFCAICKLFDSFDKNPYHCEKCGICRTHKKEQFHCDVCNVCLFKCWKGKHKCRPDAGHDECCICLKNAFAEGWILSCTHRVHKECEKAMIQNGIGTCPVCRHPFHNPAPEKC